MNKKLSIINILIFLLFITSAAFAQTKEHSVILNAEKLPELTKLSSYEPMFKDYSKIVESNSRRISAGNSPEHMFYKYKNTENFTLLGLAARCNIPYETIATLNQIESSSQNIKGRTLILPVVPGLFIPVDRGISQIEVILQENYGNQTLTKNNIYYNIESRNYLFLQSKRFSPTERAYFLDSALQLPINTDDFWISSEFGQRKNPFSGLMKHHNGIDFAAPEGTPVFAIKDGAAYCCIENDPEFGNYIILSHDQGKMTSVYAHLSKMVIDQYQAVKKGDLIGYVGQTGLATGPHLHFEIREGGKAENPRNKLNLTDK